MIKIRTVCGNGIGSSLMAAGVIRKLCLEWGIQADIKSVDLLAAQGEKADIYITAKRLAPQLVNKHVVVIRSYTNKAKIAEDIKETIINF